MRIDPPTLAHLQEWIGKTERYQDTVTIAPYRALSATLDRRDPDPINSYLMPNNLKLDPMATPNAVASYLPFHFHEECGQVVDFVGNRIL